MDEETEVTDFPSVGERLRAARQKKKLSLEDIASETRIPLRHLESLELADWERLPAPTGTGFRRRPIPSVSPRITQVPSGSTAPRSPNSCARKWADIAPTRPP